MDGWEGRWAEVGWMDRCTNEQWLSLRPQKSNYSSLTSSPPASLHPSDLSFYEPSLIHSHTHTHAHTRMHALDKVLLDAPLTALLLSLAALIQKVIILCWLSAPCHLPHSTINSIKELCLPVHQLIPKVPGRVTTPYVYWINEDNLGKRALKYSNKYICSTNEFVDYLLKY